VGAHQMAKGGEQKVSKGTPTEKKVGEDLSFAAKHAKLDNFLGILMKNSAML